MPQEGRGGGVQAVCEDFFAGPAAGVVVGGYDHDLEEVLDYVLDLGCSWVVAELASRLSLEAECKEGRCLANSPSRSECMSL